MPKIKTLFDAEERLAQVPMLNLFTEKCEMMLQSGDPNLTFWDCRQYFSSLINSNFLEQLLNYELKKTLDDNLYLPVGGISEWDLAILMTSNFTLSLKLLDPSLTISNRLYSNSQHSMMAIVGNNDHSSAIIENFYQPAPFPDDILDVTKKLISLGEKKIVKNEINANRAGYDVYRMLSVSEPIAVLFFSTKSLLSLRWEYDLENHLPCRAVSANSNSSRLDYTAKMLGEVCSSTSMTPLKKLMEHPDHFVRWSAVKSAFKIDFDEGVKLLESCRFDSHPHIREAAKNTLSRIKVQLKSE